MNGLVADNSPLRNLPSELNLRQAMFLDGIRYSLDMTAVAYERLRSNLYLVGSTEDTDELPNTAYPALFLDAWAMVDSVNRLRFLLDHLRGLKRTPDIRVFLGKLAPFERPRNDVQHLNGTIEQWADSGEVTWGSLTWFQSDAKVPPFVGSTLVLIPGTMRGWVERPAVNPAGRMFTPPVDLIELTAFGNTVSLSDAFNTLREFAGLFDDSLRESFDSTEGFSGKSLGADLLLTLELEPKPKP